MLGYSAWKIHRAVSLHLSSLKYDVFKSRGNVRGNSLDNYARLKSKYPFEFAERQCKDKQEMVQYFVSNIAYSKDDACWDLNNSWDNYREWVKNHEMMTQLILEQLDTIDTASCTTSVAGAVPDLLYKVVSRQVVPEVAVALNREFNYIDTWIAQDYTGLNKYAILIKKLDKFVRYNEQLVQQCLTEKANEAAV